ncbi:MAG: hypothetical protein KKC46_17075 [Proteobacteria bacterium]|nr:hypothetical protein [Pseudomonadota bacterium]
MNKILKSRWQYYRHVLCILLCVLILFLNGCATAWEPSGSYYRTTTTKISVASVPDGKVLINNNYVGDTPIDHTVRYEKQIDKKTRKVSYWITQPGFTLFWSIVSLGVYIPFSLIPADVETSLHPTDLYRNNEFTLKIVSEGYKIWQKEILCSGNDRLSIDTTLEKNEADK